MRFCSASFSATKSLSFHSVGKTTMRKSRSSFNESHLMICALHRANNHPKKQILFFWLKTNPKTIARIIAAIIAFAPENIDFCTDLKSILAS